MKSEELNTLKSVNPLKKAVKYHEIEHSVLQKILDCFYEKNLHPKYPHDPKYLQ